MQRDNLISCGESANENRKHNSINLASNEPLPNKIRAGYRIIINSSLTGNASQVPSNSTHQHQSSFFAPGASEKYKMTTKRQKIKNREEAIRSFIPRVRTLTHMHACEWVGPTEARAAPVRLWMGGKLRTVIPFLKRRDYSN